MGEVIPFPVPAADPASRPLSALQSVAQPPAGRRAEPNPASQTQLEPRRQPARPEPLWRAVIGEELRAARADRGERIADVAERAGMSPQYLSEIERGRKDPSSEMLAAVTGALGLTVHELARRVARRYDVMAVTLSLGSRLSPPTAPPTGPLCLAA